MPSLADALARTKTTLRLRIADLAAAAGVSTRSVDRWLSGNGAPTEKQARALLGYIASFDGNLASHLASTLDLATPWMQAPATAVAPPPVLLAPPPPPPPKPTIDGIAATLFVVAEQMHLAPRDLRVAVQRVVATWAKIGCTLADVNDVLRELDTQLAPSAPAPAGASDRTRGEK